ncbi:hypothetical protein [Larkinella soli]|uniref:hypothetical protein n=1 Tax=Larkinella soli TaxID=1770527 RepID=UPI000FFBD25A|nr:hypothetical protein [Larkinella soli]
MLKNYLKIAFRNFARHKSYSFTNLGGLTLALAGGLLISRLSGTSGATTVRRSASARCWGPAVGAAFLTNSFQSPKAALTNPVKSLKSE